MLEHTHPKSFRMLPPDDEERQAVRFEANIEHPDIFVGHGNLSSNRWTQIRRLKREKSQDQSRGYIP